MALMMSHKKINEMVAASREIKVMQGSEVKQAFACLICRGIVFVLAFAQCYTEIIESWCWNNWLENNVTAIKLQNVNLSTFCYDLST